MNESCGLVRLLSGSNQSGYMAGLGLAPRRSWMDGAEAHRLTVRPAVRHFLSHCHQDAVSFCISGSEMSGHFARGQGVMSWRQVLVAEASVDKLQ